MSKVEQDVAESFREEAGEIAGRAWQLNGKIDALEEELRGRGYDTERGSEAGNELEVLRDALCGVRSHLRLASEHFEGLCGIPAAEDVRA